MRVGVKVESDLRGFGVETGIKEEEKQEHDIILEGDKLEQFTELDIIIL